VLLAEGLRKPGATSTSLVRRTTTSGLDVGGDESDALLGEGEAAQRLLGGLAQPPTCRGQQAPRSAEAEVTIGLGQTAGSDELRQCGRALVEVESRLPEIVHGDHVVELVAGYRIPSRCERLIDGNRLADADFPKRSSGPSPAALLTA
jgi:hypothetical protein